MNYADQGCNEIYDWTSNASIAKGAGYCWEFLSCAYLWVCKIM